MVRTPLFKFVQEQVHALDGPLERVVPKSETSLHRPASTRIAVSMAVVAMLGAVAAFRTALAEQDTSRFERRLDQGKMLALSSRQEYLDKMALGIRLKSRFDQRFAEAENARTQAQTGQSAKAVGLNLKAQEEFAVAKSIIPYREFANPYYQDDLYPEDWVANVIADDLRDKGFGTISKTTPAGQPAWNIWQNLEDDISRGRTKLTRLAMAVLVFVIALAFFTFAQLKHATPQRERQLVCAGYVIAILGVTGTLITDPGVWRDFLFYILGFSFLALIGFLLSQKIAFGGRSEEDEPIHPSELDPTLFPGVRLHFAPVQHGFGRFVITGIAVTAMLSAGAGYLYSFAAIQSSSATSKAFEEQENLFKSSSRLRALAYLRLGHLVTAQEYLIRLQAAEQRLNFAHQGVAGVNEKDAQAQIDLWKRLLQRVNKPATDQPAQVINEAPLDLLNGPDGLDQDRDFPNRLVAKSITTEPERHFGLWDAQNELSLNWQKKSTTYLATLTLFAIALYLLGQSLSMGRTRAAFILVFFGCSLVCFGVTSSMAVALKPAIPERGEILSACQDQDSTTNNLAEEAARHYAKGQFFLQTYREDPQELGEAVRELKCAVAARPTFALANFSLSFATWSLGTPQLSEGGFVSITSKKLLPEIIKYDQKASSILRQQHFSPSPMIQGNLGFDTFLLGLMQGDKNALKNAVAISQAALKLSDSPEFHFNAAVALLANGEMSHALDEYQTAIKGVQPHRADLIGGAITDLNIFRSFCRTIRPQSYCAEVDSRAEEIESQLVAAAWPSHTPTPDAKMTNVDLTVFPSGGVWRAQVSNMQPKHDSPAVLWFAKDKEWNVWRVLPLISGPVENEDISVDGRHAYQYKSLLHASRRHVCLSDGNYRVEAYLNGHRVGEPETSAQGPAFIPASFAQLDLAMCTPNDWHVDVKPGLDEMVRTIQNNDHTRGATLFTYYNPKSESGDATNKKFLEASVSRFLGQAHSRPRQLSIETYCPTYPTEPKVTYAEYRVGAENLLAKGWVGNDGLAHVGIVFDHGLSENGARSDHVRQDCHILISISSIPW